MTAPLIAAVIGLIVSAALGSFLGAAFYRLPRRISLNGRSFCLTCDQSVPWYLNVPVISFLWLRGTSRCCKTPLLRRYLVLEVGTSAAGALVNVGVCLAWGIVTAMIVPFAIAVIVALSVSAVALHLEKR